MFRERLASEWSRFGSLSEDQISKLEQHYRLLIQWNTVLNLTRIQELEDVVCFHYCESLFLGSVLPLGERRIADVGSGAGFPGIPIAVLRPECSIALIESHQRKAVFLTEARASVPNVEVIQGRAETLRRRYDWVVCRAVAPRAVLALKLSASVAILASQPDLADLPRPAEVIQVPWGKQRVIALFHVEHQSAENVKI